MSELLITNLDEIATPTGATARVGTAQGEIVRHREAEVFVRDGRIVFAGPRAERQRALGGLAGVERWDAGGGTVVPGFVDAHTHLPWAGSRESEFALRLAGRSYLDIAAAGGGILSTVRSTRFAEEDTLVEATLGRLDRMLAHGTTTAEAKSGYGLDRDNEIKQLRAIRRADARHAIDLVPTLLAAHEFPPEYRDDRDGYVDLVVNEIIPTVAGMGLARFNDVFCEQGVYDVDQTRRVLEAGREHGLVPRLHADEFVDSGGARLAAELGAASADHVAAVNDEAIEAMASSGVLAVLLPAVNFYLMKEPWAPARRFVEAGVGVVLATDCNPGSSHTESLPFILQLAIFHLRMTVEEALTAVTLNAAACLGVADRVGSIEPGKQADLTILDMPNLLHLGYHIGINPVRAVFKAGRPVLPVSEDGHAR
ncbi:MAG: imidazolonepropionase [Acidobacteriota bacterium]